jgi:hypothetical protein
MGRSGRGAVGSLREALLALTGGRIGGSQRHVEPSVGSKAGGVGFRRSRRRWSKGWDWRMVGRASALRVAAQVRRWSIWAHRAPPQGHPVRGWGAGLRGRGGGRRIGAGRCRVGSGSRCRRGGSRFKRGDGHFRRAEIRRRGHAGGGARITVSSDDRPASSRKGEGQRRPRGGERQEGHEAASASAATSARPGRRPGPIQGAGLRAPATRPVPSGSTRTVSKPGCKAARDGTGAGRGSGRGSDVASAVGAPPGDVAGARLRGPPAPGSAAVRVSRACRPSAASGGRTITPAIPNPAPARAPSATRRTVPTITLFSPVRAEARLNGP